MRMLLIGLMIAGKSLIQQTYRPFGKIFAVDDGSTDGGDSKLDLWKGSHNGIPIIVLHQTAKGAFSGKKFGSGELERRMDCDY
ncbi:MAG: hypothetical protein Ct9H90mP16_15650 [Candidatus Poseidoniales archaeon]|nr:MAG: hypothetical protein Ct9H90mP16_15650 [Candidatus Poseidoniales archaeon]